jgi:glycosyltransferase involved in cell wall biosynthesis
MSFVKCNLSLVICTRNRAPQLAESLQTITRLQCQVPWELIIVDNGSKDQTQEVIKNYRESLRPKTAIEPQAGLGRARNRGWTLSQGEIVVFTDDDCYPADDFLSTVVRCFEEDPRLGVHRRTNSPPRSGGLPDYNLGTSLSTKFLPRRIHPSWPDSRGKFCLLSDGSSVCQGI